MATINKEVTLCLLVRDGNIYLAKKKRGFGKDRWNGYGGKVESGEAIRVAAIRELLEETNGENGRGITVNADHLEPVAVIEFFFKLKPEWNQRAHVFLIREWGGEPQETEEMLPAQFAVADIPYHEMWPGDRIWFPRILAGERLRGEIVFRDNEGNAERIEFKPMAV